MTRRVVVTVLGVVTPLGVGVEPVWNRLILGHSGLVRLPDAIAADLPARVAGMVPDKDDDPAGFDPEVAVSAKDLKRMDRFIHFAMVAAHEAVGQDRKSVLSGKSVSVRFILRGRLVFKIKITYNYFIL